MRPRTIGGTGASHEYAGLAANQAVKTVNDTVINSYEDGMEFIEGGVILAMRKIASNVWVVYRDGCVDQGCPVDFECIEIQLYDTPVVRYYPDGTFSVDNGGWNTPTTSRRITQFTPDGWAAYHEKCKLGIWRWRERRQEIYPATHDKKIDPTGGEQ